MPIDSSKTLFHDRDLASVLDAHLRSVVDKVNEIQRDQFLVSSEEEIVTHVLSDMYINPIALYEDNATTKVEEIQLDPRYYPERWVTARSMPYIPGTQVTITIPFSGDEKLWDLQPSHYSSILPHGEIQSRKQNRIGYLRLFYEQPADSPIETIYDEHSKQIGLIKDYLHNQEVDIKKCNDQLESRIHQAIKARLERLEKQNGIVKLLGIPLEQKEGVPDILPIRVERRLITPLPPPPKSGFQPEPGIIDEIFENILLTIRHEGRTYETTPSTYAVHDEEGLRDILIAHLNGHFKGGATGETFRKKGKTDIRIEAQDRSAFIAECKVWEGQNKLQDAVNQLLGYLTWRDCKCALIIFNKHNAKFSELLEKVPNMLRSDPRIYKDLGEKCQGEWRFILTSQEDEARRIIVHVFLFDLFVANDKSSK